MDPRRPGLFFYTSLEGMPHVLQLPVVVGSSSSLLIFSLPSDGTSNPQTGGVWRWVYCVALGNGQPLSLALNFWLTTGFYHMKKSSDSKKLQVTSLGMERRDIYQ